jgi:uncharacterized RmlC-like cupin family protein
MTTPDDSSPDQAATEAPLRPLLDLLKPADVPYWQRPHLAMLTDALAGVPVTTGESRAVGWLCQADTHTAQRLAALIRRVRAAEPARMIRSEVEEAARETRWELAQEIPVTLHAVAAEAATMSRQGQPLVPVISRPHTQTRGISSAEVSIPPGHRAKAHVHFDTDVIVTVLYGQAVTLWWDQDGQRHEVPQSAGQQLHIPRGVPHAAVNLGPVPVIALECRSNSVFDADNVLLANFDAQVADYAHAAGRQEARTSGRRT